MMPDVKEVKIPANSDELLPSRPKILLVDDNDSVLNSLSMVLKHSGFEVVSATNVNDALKHIGSQSFDVLLSDLHMPNPGDGLTVVSAMRHSHPKAVTLLFSGYPAMKEAAAAILLQADEILVKPLEVETLIKTIRDRLKLKRTPTRPVETVAAILEQETQSTISDWLLRVELEPEIITVRLGSAARCAHLPQLFRDLVSRLRQPLPLGTRAGFTRIPQPRTSAAQARLQPRHAGGGIAHAAGQHLPDLAKQSSQGGFQPCPGGRNGHRRRGGLAIGASHGQLHFRIEGRRSAA